MADVNGSCWECVAKRRVCDLARPACRKCRARGIDCPGYDQKPLKWLQPGQTRSKGQRARDELRASHQKLALCTSLRDPHEATAIIEAFEYYNTNVCPDMVAAGNGTQSEFFMPLAAAPYVPPAIAQCLVGVAFGHRILQFQKGFESERLILAKRLQNHRGAAIRFLSEDLSKPDCHNRDETLFSVLTLLLSEIQQSISLNWRQHCDGAFTIIELRGGMPLHILSQRGFRHLFQYLVLVDVMGATTSPSVEMNRAQRQLELINLLPNLYGIGISTSLPCPPELLAAVIMVNEIRSRRHAIGDVGGDSRADALGILAGIRSFSPAKWAAEVKKYHLSGPIKSKIVADEVCVPQRQASSWDWHCIAAIFQAAVALYCISSTIDLEDIAFSPQRVGEDIPGLWAMYYDALVSNLRLNASSQPSQIRKLVFWPLLIAGIETDDTQVDHRTFIIGELEWISGGLGTTAPLVAKDFLTRLWQSSARQKSNGRTWDDLFDRPYIFAV